MNEMNGKYTIEVLKESDLALLVGGSKASYQRGLITGLLLRGVFIGTPFFRR
ncbi:hypothetical protein [uncultured Streptococcus sp.]|uniref:hypothetical protein n=1 Tax=uncultured Streptococcus sp. TaxID=83427 RepID=UPI0025E5ADF3|nr:hypothetical protein [uncultured Streptococcus sp.]